jgi:RNA polymerase sigma-70 factor (ECF subfamily)
MDELEIVRTFKEKTGTEKDKAFITIVNQYRERLYAIIRSYVKDHDDADDLLQETFMKAYQHLSGFRGDSGLYTWLTRIAINHTLSHLRKMKLRSWIPLDQVTNSLAAPQPLPDALADQAQMKQWIQEATDTLPAKQKTVFILRYVDDLSHADIAKITGNSEGTIKANYFHALNKIKDYIERKQKPSHEKH